MLECFPVVMIVSAVLGFLAGLGVGGGSLLILWLTVFVTMDHPQARIINLLFFLPSALICSIFRIRQGSLPLKKAFPAIVVGSIAAAAFSLFARQIETDYLKKAFGVLLLFTGTRELFYSKRRT